MTMQLVKVTEAHHWDPYHYIRQLVLYELRGRDGYDAQHPDEYRDDHAIMFLSYLCKLESRSELCAWILSAAGEGLFAWWQSCHPVKGKGLAAS